MKLIRWQTEMEVRRPWLVFGRRRDGWKFGLLSSEDCSNWFIGWFRPASHAHLYNKETMPLATREKLILICFTTLVLLGIIGAAIMYASLSPCASGSRYDTTKLGHCIPMRD